MAEPALCEDNLDIIIEKMYKVKGWDFHRYRKSSLRRCVERRLAFSGIPYEDYIEYLDKQPLELNVLFNHITIKVSEFFRDTEVFNHIKGIVIPATFERLSSEGQNLLRAWSCGCAHGEEAYSIAMLLSMSGMESLSIPPFIKIFATDIDEMSIDFSRKGIYPRDSIMNVDPNLRIQFFKSTDIENKYQVIPQTRNLITFGVHNIVSDIHLSHMDIILCRNLLIYFEKDLQERVFEKFYHSLNKGGFIILGKSEVIPPKFRDSFQEVARKEKIYQKIQGSRK
jgi:chemotaxis methyl-accepting protein methylase